MKFAFIDSDRRLAERGLRGACPGCGQEVLAKCGNRRIHHWAHIGIMVCDGFWEPETQWHRDWKDRFPAGWQEQRRVSSDGELHIADVLTEAGVALEFQRSHISDEEKRCREQFHRRIVWVADGTRLKRDHSSFRRLLSSAPITLSKYLAFVLPRSGSPILERWSGGHTVYLDFGKEPCGIPGLPEDRLLWRLRYRGSDVVAMPVSYDSFVSHHRDLLPIEGFSVPISRVVRLTEFQRQLMSKARRRARF